MLDEPVAMLDPVARHDFMASVLAAAAADGVSVLLSSHVLAELERVADNPGLFDLREVALPAWTLAAFAIGVLAGMLIRRVVPAITATLAVYAGLAFAAACPCVSTTWRRWSPPA